MAARTGDYSSRRCHTIFTNGIVLLVLLILLICAAEMRMANYSYLDDATYWRTRAKEMRALAQQAGAFDRNDILGMAEDYERLAERADELARFARKYCAKKQNCPLSRAHSRRGD